MGSTPALRSGPCAGPPPLRPSRLRRTFFSSSPPPVGATLRVGRTYLGRLRGGRGACDLSPLCDSRAEAQARCATSGPEGPTDPPCRRARSPRRRAPIASTWRFRSRVDDGVNAMNAGSFGGSDETHHRGGPRSRTQRPPCAPGHLRRFATPGPARVIRSGSSTLLTKHTQEGVPHERPERGSRARPGEKHLDTSSLHSAVAVSRPARAPLRHGRRSTRSCNHSQ